MSEKFSQYEAQFGSLSQDTIYCKTRDSTLAD